MSRQNCVRAREGEEVELWPGSFDQQTTTTWTWGTGQNGFEQDSGSKSDERGRFSGTWKDTVWIFTLLVTSFNTVIVTSSLKTHYLWLISEDGSRFGHEERIIAMRWHQQKGKTPRTSDRKHMGGLNSGDSENQEQHDHNQSRVWQKSSSISLFLSIFGASDALSSSFFHSHRSQDVMSLTTHCSSPKPPKLEHEKPLLAAFPASESGDWWQGTRGLVSQSQRRCPLAAIGSRSSCFRGPPLAWRVIPLSSLRTPTAQCWLAWLPVPILSQQD